MGHIQRQGLINTIIVYVGVVLGFVNFVVIQTHYMKPEIVGLNRVIFSFSSFLTPFLLLGSSNMCLRYFPQFRDREKRHHGFMGLMLLIAFAGIVIGGIILWFLRTWIINAYKDESALFVDYFALTCLLGVIISLTIAMNIYCSSLFKTIFPSFLNDIWVRVLLIVISLGFIFGYLSLNEYVLGIIIVYGSQLVLLFIYAYRIDRPGILIDWSFVKTIGFSSIMKYSLLIMLSALSTLSMKFLDSIMIGAYLPLTFVGTFGIGVLIAGFVETPINPIERIAGAKIAHAFKENNMNEIKEIYFRSVKYLFLLGGFLVVCIISGVHDFLKLLPVDYKDAANVTIILSVGSIINMATGVNSPILQNSARYIWGTIFLFILLVLSVSLNMLLIPKYGIEGAAIATGLASTLYNFMKFFYIWQKFGLQPYNMNSIKTIFVIGVSLCVGLFLPEIHNPWIALATKAVCITTVFGALTYILKIVPEYHEPVLRRIFPNRK